MIIRETSNKTRTGISIAILILIALVFTFRVGSYLDDQWYILYQSYAADILVPIAAYFMLCMNDHQFYFIHKWYLKAIIAFIVMTTSEVLQYFDIYFFGVTFDPIDILMYAFGVLLASFIDRIVLTKIFFKWNDM